MISPGWYGQCACSLCLVTEVTRHCRASDGVLVRCRESLSFVLRLKKRVGK
jgi:hypothetical protein